MIRVDSEITAKIIKELEGFNNSINWDGNTYKGNDNNVQFFYNLSKSTTSIYVTIRSNGDFENQTTIRISNHCRSLKFEGKDIDIDFNDFNISEIKNIYNSYN